MLCEDDPKHPTPFHQRLSGWLRDKFTTRQSAPQWIVLSTLTPEEENEKAENALNEDEKPITEFTAQSVSQKLQAMGIHKIAITLILAALFIALASVFYHLSLESGSLDWLHDNLPKLARWVLLSVVFFFVGYGFLFFPLKKKMPLALSCTLTIVVSIILWFTLFSQNLSSTLEEHGLYNALVFGIVTTILLIYFATWAIPIKFFGKRAAAIGHVSVVLLIIIVMSFTNRTFKKEWREGIRGRQIENNGIGCDIPEDFVPYAAYLPRGYLAPFASQTCSPVEKFAEIDQNYVLTITCPEGQEAWYIENPNDLLTRSNDELLSWFESLKVYYQKNIPEQTHNYTAPIRIYSEFVEARCGNEKANFFVINQVNQTIIENAKKENYNSSQTGLSHPPNIVVVFIDALARAHVHRRLPKFLETLSMLDESEQVNVYEFFKYHSMAPHTGPNTVPMFTGGPQPDWDYNVSASSPPSSSFSKYPNDTLWWKMFDDQYVKSYEYGSCEDWAKIYFDDKEIPYETDHFVVMPFCQKEAFPDPKPLGPFQGPFSISARCLGGEHVHNYVLDYTKDLWRNYNETAKLVHMSFLEAHEGSLDVIGQVDDDLSAFMLSDEIQSELDNTFFFFVSDHGNHMSPFFLWTEGGKVESRLPMFFTVTPKWFSERYAEMSENLFTNQNRLVNGFDLYNTMMELRALPEFGQKNATAPVLQSLFKEVPEDRSCQDANIHDWFCTCSNK